MSTQLCDPDSVMDAVESLAGQGGMEALTLRGVTTVTGASMATIYRMYGCRECLIGQAWLRAARRFIGLLTTLVDQAHADGTAIDALFAAAETSLVYPRRYPRSGALLWAVSRQELVTLTLPDEIVDQLRSVDHEFVEVITRLSLDVWDRKDDRALRLISACVIDLPGRILIGRRRYSASVVREYLHAAIRGIVGVGPPPDDQ